MSVPCDSEIRDSSLSRAVPLVRRWRFWPTTGRVCRLSVSGSLGCVHAKWLQQFTPLCDPMDCSPPGSSVHEIPQARGLGLPGPPAGDLPDPGIKPSSFMSPALSGRFFTTSHLGNPDLWVTPRKFPSLLLSLVCNFVIKLLNYNSVISHQSIGTNGSFGQVPCALWEYIPKPVKLTHIAKIVTRIKWDDGCLLDHNRCTTKALKRTWINSVRLS